MNQDVIFYLRSLARLIYFVTDEEDKFIAKFQDVLSKYVKRTWVYNAAFGLVPIEQLTKDWQTRAHAQNDSTLSINDAMVQIYRDDPKEEQNFYIITDPERWLSDPHVVRRVLNVVHQLHNNIRTVKIIVFVGPRKYIPEKLQRYVEVVHDHGLTAEEIEAHVTDTCGHLKLPTPKDSARIFRGLTTFEINAAIAQSIIKTKKDPSNPKRIDPEYVSEFKRRQLHKTDLLQYVDTSVFTFDDVGGNARFKEWARKTRAVWTDDGAAFGLKPPKGVLCVGVWGCGKSLSVKAMAHAWGLPMVSLEMGRLRNSGVGDSESNVYRALRLIESVCPCVVWMDEAEKSLSGAQSSAQSDAGTTSRMIGILSTWLQETTLPVCVAMTANSINTLPIEFINRMDERFFFDLPSEEERVDILKIHLRKAHQDYEGFSLADLSEKAKNMVGREIEQAIGAAMTESFDQGKKALDEGVLAIELDRKPRIFRTMVDELKEILDWVGYDETVNEGIRARFASDRRSETFNMVRTEES